MFYTHTYLKIEGEMRQGKTRTDASKRVQVEERSDAEIKKGRDIVSRPRTFDLLPLNQQLLL